MQAHFDLASDTETWIGSTRAAQLIGLSRQALYAYAVELQPRKKQRSPHSRQYADNRVKPRLEYPLSRVIAFAERRAAHKVAP